MSERSSDNGHVSSAAYLDADGAMWLATGETHRDDHPMAEVLNRLDAEVPATERYDWLAEQREAFDGKSAFDLIDDEQLQPIIELLGAPQHASHQ